MKLPIFYVDLENDKNIIESGSYLVIENMSNHYHVQIRKLKWCSMQCIFIVHSFYA